MKKCERCGKMTDGIHTCVPKKTESKKCYVCDTDTSNFGNPIKTIDGKIYCDTNCYADRWECDE